MSQSKLSQLSDTLRRVSTGTLLADAIAPGISVLGLTAAEVLEQVNVWRSRVQNDPVKKVRLDDLYEALEGEGFWDKLER